MIKNNQSLISIREQCINERAKQETELMADLYQQNQISPCTFKQRQVKLEKWVTLQKSQVEHARVGFKQEWEKTMYLIEQTQSDQDFMRSKVDSRSSRKEDNVYSPTEQPSAAFITRLEKAFLPLSNELTLNISE